MGNGNGPHLDLHLIAELLSFPGQLSSGGVGDSEHHLEAGAAPGSPRHTHGKVVLGGQVDVGLAGVWGMSQGIKRMTNMVKVN